MADVDVYAMEAELDRQGKISNACEEHCNYLDSEYEPMSDELISDYEALLVDAEETDEVSPTKHRKAKKKMEKAFEDFDDRLEEHLELIKSEWNNELFGDEITAECFTKIHSIYSNY